MSDRSVARSHSVICPSPSERSLGLGERGNVLVDAVAVHRVLDRRERLAAGGEEGLFHLAGPGDLLEELSSTLAALDDRADLRDLLAHPLLVPHEQSLKSPRVEPARAARRSR